MQIQLHGIAAAIVMSATLAIGQFPASAQLPQPPKVRQSDHHTAGSNPGVPWPATDALGRSLPTPAEVGPLKPDHFVGIFYFLTHNEGPDPGHLDGPMDITKILKKDPDALNKPNSPLWGHIGESHYWAEPLYGYYRSDDPWVLRRHAQLLSDAGVDVLIFDTTNAKSYPEIYFQLL